jgi:uncharacterized membrane protein YeaQ/YmgE (transglycosylase-associated protein family)
MGKIFFGITFIFVLQIFIVGLTIGALARLFIPGPNPMTWGRTSLIGIIGALLGGFISGILGMEGLLAATLQIGAAAGIILYLERR